MKKHKIINSIKESRDVVVDDQWLKDGKKSLFSFISDNPVRNDNVTRRNRQRGTFKKLISKPMPIAIMAIIASLITGGGAVAASQNSLPTDTLYPVKLIVEEVEEAMTVNNVKKVELHTKLAERRLNEIKELQRQEKDTKEIVEESLEKYQSNVIKAQHYLGNVSRDLAVKPEEVLSASINISNAVDSQQAIIADIENESADDYKKIVEEKKQESLNNLDESLSAIRIKIDEEDRNDIVKPVFSESNDEEIIKESAVLEMITEQEAVKIADKYGLEKGIKELKIDFYWYEGGINDYVWSISNVLSETTGQTIIINARTGEVYKVFSYNILTNDKPISAEPKPLPLPSPMPSPVESDPLPSPVDCSPVNTHQPDIPDNYATINECK